jgi:hypothetical protein
MNTLLLTLVLLSTIIHSGNAKEKPMEDLFEQAVANTGRAYINARNDILKRPADARLFFNQKAFAPEDWLGARTAEIIQGWINNKAQFEQAGRFAEGKVMTKRASGHPRSEEMAERLAGMGDTVVPRIIEKILKDTENRSEYSYDVLFQAITMLNDTRTYEPLQAIIKDSSKEPILRSLATDALVSMHVTDIDAVLKQILNDTNENKQYRAEIPPYLMALSAETHTEYVIAMLNDTETPSFIRAAAAESLGFGSPQTVKPVLEKTVVEEVDSSVKKGALTALQKVGDENTISLLQDLDKKGAPKEIRDLLQRTIAEIKFRLGI